MLIELKWNTFSVSIYYKSFFVMVLKQFLKGVKDQASVEKSDRSALLTPFLVAVCYLIIKNYL